MSTADLISLIGLLATVIAMVYLCYRGWSLPLLMMGATVLVILTSQLNFFETWDSVMALTGNMAGQFLPVWLLGCVIAALYLESGAGESFGKACMRIFVRSGSDATKRTVTIVIILLLGAVIAWTGINSVWLHAAIAVGMMAVVNIPRKYLVVFVVLGQTIGNIIPGSVQFTMMADMYIPVDNPYTGTAPAFICSVFLLVAGTWLLVRDINKDLARGNGFAYGPLTPAAEKAPGEEPPAIFAIIPVLVIGALYIFVGWDAWLALGIGMIVSALLFAKWLLPTEEEKKEGTGKMGVLKRMTQTGTTTCGIPAVMILTYMLGFVIEQTPAFTIMGNFFSSLAVTPMLGLGFMGTLLTGVSCGASGMMVTFAAARDVFIPMGVSVAAARMISMLTSTVLDTLPTRMDFINMSAWCGLPMKETYPPVFKTTVALTFVNLLLCIVLYMVFPF